MIDKHLASCPECWTISAETIEEYAQLCPVGKALQTKEAIEYAKRQIAACKAMVARLDYAELVDRDELFYNLMMASYEFNRGANLTASRHHRGVAAHLYLADLLSNFEQVAIGIFQSPPPPELGWEREMMMAADALYQALSLLPVLPAAAS